jgi:hypothetical protein
MKRLLLALTLALLVSISLSVGAASASHTNGVGPKKDLVVGSAKGVVPSTTLYIPLYIHINAQSGPAGENARGHFVIRTFLIDATGEVVCLIVRDNRTFVVGYVGRTKGGVQVWQAVGLWVDDHGQGNETNDKTNFTFAGSPEPGLPPRPTDEECRRIGDVALSFPPPSFVMTQGDFIVHDATP